MYEVDIMLVFGIDRRDDAEEEEIEDIVSVRFLPMLRIAESQYLVAFLDFLRHQRTLLCLHLL